MNLTVLNDVKLILNHKTDGDDTRLNKLIELVSAEMETYLDRFTKRQTNKIEIFDGLQRVQVRGFPISTLTDVRSDSERVFGSSTVVDSKNYYADLERGVITIDKQFVRYGPGTLRVQYTGGMGTDTANFMSLYPDIASAASIEVAFRFQRTKEVGLVAVAAGGASLTLQLQEQFLPVVKAALDRHLRIG